MNNQIASEIVGSWFMPWTHQAMIEYTEDLTEEQFSQQPSATAPPIAWHLFHIARWADRLQASFPNRPPNGNHQPDLPGQIWLIEDLATQWDHLPASLGWLDTGSGMPVDQAVALAGVGQPRLLDYARRSFAAADQAVAVLSDDALLEARHSIIPELQIDSNGEIKTTGPREVTILFDLMFHTSHASRHIGMIEALRGAMFSIPGTATI